jgi:hypothetical protein
MKAVYWVALTDSSWVATRVEKKVAWRDSMSVEYLVAWKDWRSVEY